MLAQVEDSLLVFIPVDLRAKLFALRPTLEANGIVQRHRRVWRLRYRAAGEHGERRHFSLRLGGDDRVAHAVQALVEGWRAEVAERRRLEAEQILKRKLDIKAIRLAAMMATDGGRDRRMAAARAAEQAFNGSPQEMLRLMVSPSLLPPKGRPGRPRKFQLW